MHTEPLHPHDEEDDEDYIYPQMSYCCGSRGIEISPKFKDRNTQGAFVGLTFGIKLLELTFISFVVYDLAADSEDQLKFNITQIEAVQLKPYNWILFVAAALVVIVYSAARCSGAGRGLCCSLILNLFQTFCLTVFSGALITTDLVYPFRYVVFLILVAIAIYCMLVCLLTTIFEINVMGRDMYRALFLAFLFLFFAAHFLYFANLREKHKMPYTLFLMHVGIGVGVGKFIGMVMFWYVQELISGKVISLHESEYLYVCLLI